MVPAMSPAAVGGKNGCLGPFSQGSMGTLTLQKCRREEQPSQGGWESRRGCCRLCAACPMSCLVPLTPPATAPRPWKSPFHAWRCQQLPEDQPAGGSQEATFLSGTTRYEGSIIWKTLMSRICQTQHISSTSPQHPSPLLQTLVAFSIVVFFLLKTGLLLCREKGPVCGVQLHFKGTLLVSYEFACLY